MKMLNLAAAMALTAVGLGRGTLVTATPEPFPPEPPLPRKASNDSSHPDYHSASNRIGLMVNGRLRTNVQQYDMDKRWLKTIQGKEEHNVSIRPYWRKQAASHRAVEYVHSPEAKGKRAKRRARGKVKGIRA